jgi:hypothetical protein
MVATQVRAAGTVECDETRIAESKESAVRLYGCVPATSSFVVAMSTLRMVLEVRSPIVPKGNL